MTDYTRPTPTAIASAARDYHDVGSPAEQHTTMTYGTLPELEDFSLVFDAYCPYGKCAFENDPYVGNDALTESQLWRELQTQHATWEAGEHASDCEGDGSCRGEGCPCEDAGSWCSSVLGILGFEWV